jgi:hypothetical protein
MDPLSTLHDVLQDCASEGPLESNRKAAAPNTSMFLIAVPLFALYTRNPAVSRE